MEQHWHPDPQIVQAAEAAQRRAELAEAARRPTPAGRHLATLSEWQAQRLRAEALAHEAGIPAISTYGAYQGRLALLAGGHWLLGGSELKRLDGTRVRAVSALLAPPSETDRERATQVTPLREVTTLLQLSPRVGQAVSVVMSALTGLTCALMIRQGDGLDDTVQFVILTASITLIFFFANGNGDLNKLCRRARLRDLLPELGTMSLLGLVMLVATSTIRRKGILITPLEVGVTLLLTGLIGALWLSRQVTGQLLLTLKFSPQLRRAAEAELEAVSAQQDGAQQEGAQP